MLASFLPCVQLANTEVSGQDFGGTETTRTELRRVTIKQSLSDKEDADLATAITQLSLQQVAVEATSQAFTKIFNTSLLNFLK